TLLKLLAGIYVPTSGQIHTNGSLTPFIELGVGFNPELTGRENVYLNGALLGFSRKAMQAMYQDIVEFAELGKFMDQKLKNYSSGMQVRLAFSIATRVRSDILLIDEVLAVGDLDFQKKCYNYFLELKRQKRTIVFVSHDMSAIRRFCTRCILINEGDLVKEGGADEVADMYENMNLRTAEDWINKYNGRKDQNLYGTREITIEKVETFSPGDNRAKTTFNPTEKIGVRITFKCHQAINAPAVGFIFQNENDVTVFATNNQIAGAKTKALDKGDVLVAETVVDNIFTDGEYTLTAAIESEDFGLVYDRVEYIHKFIVGGHKLPHALAHPAHKMKITYRRGK
ncbi:MAG TPA: ABC transporter ATP-binding protein, partial [Candidatus Saccharimonadales bacterium]|nr:ABC transporter ATP-binding protein [Candidatus Saccharimonadales bacterium]